MDSRWLQARSGLRLACVLLLVLIGAGLRFAHIAQPIRSDEAMTYLRYARLPLDQGLALYDDVNNHLLHTLLLHLSLPLFGAHEVGLRVPVLLAGLLLLPISYWMARQYLPWPGAALALAFVAISPELILYSTNARGYMLQAVIVALMLGLLPRLRHERRPLPWIAFGLLAALGFYSVPTFFFAMGGMSVWLSLSLLIETRGAARRSGLIALGGALLLGALLTLMLYAPTFQNDSSPLQARAIQMLNESWLARLPNIPNNLLRGIAGGLPGWLLILAGLGVLVSLLLPRRTMGIRVPLLLAFALYAIAHLLIQRVVPQARNWVPLIPLFALLASAGLSYLLRRRPVLLLLLSLALALGIGAHVLQTRVVFLSWETGRMPNAPQLAHDLLNFLEPGDVILYPGPFHHNLGYYIQRYGGDDAQIQGILHAEFPFSSFARAERLFILSNIDDDRLIIQQLGLENELARWMLRVDRVPEFTAQTMLQIAVLPLPEDGRLFFDFESESALLPLNPDAARLRRETETNQVLEIGADESAEQVLFASTRWPDLKLSGWLRLEAASPTSEEDLAILFRRLPSVGHYAALLKAGGYIGLSASDQPGLVRFAGLPLQTGEWLAFSLTLRGSSFVWQVGDAMLEYEDERFVLGGLLLRTAPGTRLWFDDLILDLPLLFSDD